MQALYEFDATNMLGGEEYKGMFDDLARFIFIQLMIQAMLVMMDPTRYQFFATDFIVLLLFVVLGVMFYWLVFKKLVHIV